MTDLSNQKVKSFRLSKGKTSFKQLGLVLIIALFFIGPVLLVDWRAREEMKDAGSNNQAQKELLKDGKESEFQAPKVKFFDDQPPQLLAEIPHYEETEKVESFSVKFPDAVETQNIYRFYSAKSGEEIFNFYKNWAEKNGWRIEEAVKEQAYNYQALFVSKADSKAWIKINKEGEKTRVSIEMF